MANFLYSRSVEEERSIRAESPSQQSKTDLDNDNAIKKRYICDVTLKLEFRTILVEDNIYRFLCNLIGMDTPYKESLARTILQGYLSVIPESELKQLP